MSEFNHTDEEFVKVLNHILKEEDMPLMKDISSKLPSEDFDSLDIITFFGWLSELYGLEATLLEIQDMVGVEVNVRELKGLVSDKATKNFLYTDLKGYNII